MQTITYLLGAGASADCIPVVKDMATRVFNMNNMVGAKFYEKGLERTIGTQALADMQKDLEWLGNVCKNHYSVDTYAKKLFISENDNDYSRLKTILSIYFTLEQKFELPDKRYDNFWASILDYKDKFPKHMRIISWNYDSQLELSYRNFVSSDLKLEEAYRRIRMKSFHSNEKPDSCDEFSIFKLNGSARTIQRINGKNQSNYMVKNFAKDDFGDFFQELFKSHALLKQNRLKTKDEAVTNELSFAWEHDTSMDFYKDLSDSVSETTILVVIGYSFPFFNRKIDKLIIDKFMPNLQKVYFQAPDAENLQERFLAVTRKINVHSLFLRKDKDQFTFPNELEL